MKKGKNILKSILRPLYRKYKQLKTNRFIREETKKLLIIPNNRDQRKIFYLGVAQHPNLGDLAQTYCIREWLKLNYPSIPVHEFGAPTVVNTRYNFLGKLENVLNENDIIFFQSGYTTQDLGGEHDLMHRVIIDKFRKTKIVMLPQTIFFKSEANKKRTSVSYNQAENMLYLSRDKVSYKMALEMFPDVTNLLYPDIVTSLIGKYNFHNKRSKIMMCCRNDGEKYYSDSEIYELRDRLSKIEVADLSDTTIKVPYKKINKRLEYYIEREIEMFSKYKLTITDRYHGTIFSLAANTPVIIIKTTDHKVTTGADWFKGIYDEHVYVAESLNHAYELAKDILNSEEKSPLISYFDTEYYQKLKGIITQKIED